MSERVVEFVDLINFENDYEILNYYPYTIRRKSNHYEVKEGIDDKGYIRIVLNGKIYRKHRLIALQFIPNHENLPQVDHINHDKTDYHVENLRWCNNSTNGRNRTSHKNDVTYTFVNEIDPDSIMIDKYGKHRFENYYYDATVEKFYYDNEQQYRELHFINSAYGTKYVWMISTDNKRVNVYYSKFKELYGLK